MTSKAVLALENGVVFQGAAIGIDGQSVGEVVFNTAMTGYQEILTDPSYARQIVTLTYPHIGNTGVNDEDEEAGGVQTAGLVIRDLPMLASNWRSQQSLQDYLVDQQVVAIAGIDTRMLTRILREEGAQGGCLFAAPTISDSDIAAALAAARGFGGLAGLDLAKEVTTASAYPWRQKSWQLTQGYTEQTDFTFKVVAYDFGAKRNILRMLVDRGCDLTVVPATTSAEEVLAMQPDGVFLSNGPGDPEPCDYAIAAIQQLLAKKVPLFGICLGHQLLGLSVGMKSVKMNLGHHGANHPVKDMASGMVLITSQNHGFCLDDSQPVEGVHVTHRSLFDDTVQGIELTAQPAFGFQGHPEASPGPHDAAPLFDHFIELMSAYQTQTSE